MDRDNVSERRDKEAPHMLWRSAVCVRGGIWKNARKLGPRDEETQQNSFFSFRQEGRIFVLLFREKEFEF